MRLAYANWKMAQSRVGLEAFARGFGGDVVGVEVGVFPSYVYMSQVLELKRSWLVGGQDCSTERSGAFTGEVSAQSLKDVGADAVLIGHSERRTRAVETAETLGKKLNNALEAGLKVTFCVGETLAQRESGLTEKIVGDQLQVLKGQSSGIVVAYEPVWAIGTGRIPQNGDIQRVHEFIWSRWPDLRGVLYGGSVKPDNAQEIADIQGVSGFLVGGASLEAKSFSQIVAALR